MKRETKNREKKDQEIIVASNINWDIQPYLLSQLESVKIWRSLLLPNLVLSNKKMIKIATYVSSFIFGRYFHLAPDVMEHYIRILLWGAADTMWVCKFTNIIEYLLSII